MGQQKSSCNGFFYKLKKNTFNETCTVPLWVKDDDFLYTSGKLDHKCLVFSHQPYYKIIVLQAEIIHGKKTSVVDYSVKDLVQVYLGVNDMDRNNIHEFPELKHEAIKVKHVFNVTNVSSASMMLQVIFVLTCKKCTMYVSVQ